MQRRSFDTPFGEVWLWGEESAFGGSKPLVFAILGAFNIEERWSDHIAERLPEVAVVSAQLPGNHCPQPAEHSVAAYAAAYSAVLARLDRPAIVMGASVGGLVGLAMDAANLRGLVALEPPLHTAKAWPITDSLRERLAEAPQDRPLGEFAWNVFGVGVERSEDRDYSALVRDCGVPTLVLVGDEPLSPVRELSKAPSLLDEEDHRLIRANPAMRLVQIQGTGHNIVDGGYTFVLDALAWLATRTTGVDVRRVTPGLPLR